ncbi:MAG: hypothetical protein AB7K09_01265 [Planctomycetota bacterium]
MTHPAAIRRLDWLRRLRRNLLLPLALLCLPAVVTSCYGRSHPDPPPVQMAVLPGSDVLGPTRTSSATLDDLQRMVARQHELFGFDHRLGPGDHFMLNVLNHPEWNASVTVLPDGRFHYGLLRRAVMATGRTFAEVVDDLVLGDPRLAPCPNCGWFHPPGDPPCPVCGTVRSMLADTARVILSSTARHNVQAAGGPLHPDARPLRALRLPGGSGSDFLIICRRAIFGLDFRDRIEARLTWTYQTRDTVLAEPADGNAASLDPVTGPIAIRLGRRWHWLNPTDGSVQPVPDAAAASLRPWRLPAPPVPSGLNYHFDDPQVLITEYQPVNIDLAVNVIGAVNAPGRIELKPGDRLWDAITDAGGPLVRQSRVLSTTNNTRDTVRSEPTVDWTRAMVLRSERYLPREFVPEGTHEGALVRLAVDFKALADGSSDNNVPLFPDDVIFIPEYAPDQISVLAVGEVRAGEYVMDKPGWLMTLMARVGWLDETRADLGSVLLVRRPEGPGGERKAYVVNVMAVAKGQAPDVQLADGDILYVYKDLITDIKDALTKISPLLIGPADLARGTRSAWEALIDQYK